MMNHSNHHISVLLNETIDCLPMVENGIYVDCTLGMGGHTKAIWSKLKANSQLICFDKDLFAIESFEQYIKNHKINNIKLIHDDFKNIKKTLQQLQINQVDGIVFDLGVSSPQLDNVDRGFSYQKNGPLDMRMNKQQAIDAQYVVNNYSSQELIRIFKEYGQSKYAKKIAHAIVTYRQKKLITETLQLVDIIKQNLPRVELNKSKHPAKVFFQAIRIEVNNELVNLYQTIMDACSLLKPNGVIAIISFHSLEDQIVKQCFRELTTSKIPAYLPVENKNVNYELVKTIVPSKQEIIDNPRARSAKLRVIKRKEK